MARRTRQLSERAKRETGETGEPQPASMNPMLAAVYAKLLACGCPKVRAVLYCQPELAQLGQDGIDIAKQLAYQWSNDALVQRALNDMYGGTFADLPPEKRFKLAIEKSNTEAAFFLWSNNFSEVGSKEEIEKLKLARDIIKVELKQQPDETDPMQAFARFAYDMVKNASSLRAQPTEVEYDPTPSLHDDTSRPPSPPGKPRVS